MTKEKPLSEKFWDLFNEDYKDQSDLAIKRRRDLMLLKGFYGEAVAKLKEYLDYRESYGIQKYTVPKIKEEIDKIFGEFNSPQGKNSEKKSSIIPEDTYNSPHTKTHLAGGKSLSENKTEDNHALCECGHNYVQHSCSNDDGSFNKDKENNPLHLGFCHWCECLKFKPAKKDGCGKKIAKRCLNFKGFYCHNKDCLNESCPLCPACEEKK